MKRKEIEFIDSVNKLMGSCPAVRTGFGSPTATAAVYIAAYSDYKEICALAYSAIDKYLRYKDLEKHLGKPEVDMEYIEELLAAAYQRRDELKSYVEERAKAGWN